MHAPTQQVGADRYSLHWGTLQPAQGHATACTGGTLQPALSPPLSPGKPLPTPPLVHLPIHTLRSCSYLYTLSARAPTHTHSPLVHLPIHTLHSCTYRYILSARAPTHTHSPLVHLPLHTLRCSTLSISLTPSLPLLLPPPFPLPPRRPVPVLLVSAPPPPCPRRPVPVLRDSAPLPPAPS